MLWIVGLQHIQQITTNKEPSISSRTLHLMAAGSKIIKAYILSTQV